ncbi:hypothetical protein MML48_8g00005795 [Holotrichia oblita]|nr:hypothetical protein MML48_8g00005795 [Holotrichia oblita]
MACGTGLGTVDPDWPHFKAMDAILSKQGHRKDPLTENYLEGPRCEDIKQEIDIDLNDDMDSFEANESVGSDYDERSTPPPLHPAPLVSVKSADQLKASTSEIHHTNNKLPTIVPSFTLPQNFQAGQSTNGVRSGGMPSIPVPLLILNSLQPQHSQEKNKDGSANSQINEKNSSDLQFSLKELVIIQRENLELERQRLEVEKQRLEFERLVGTQLITLIPMIGSLLQHLTTKNEDSPDEPPSKRSRKRSNFDQLDMFKDNKMLQTTLEQVIKQYMLQNEKDEETTENEDSGIKHDEDSSESTKE